MVGVVGGKIVGVGAGGGVGVGGDGKAVEGADKKAVEAGDEGVTDGVVDVDDDGTQAVVGVGKCEIVVGQGVPAEGVHV